MAKKILIARITDPSTFSGKFDDLNANLNVTSFLRVPYQPQQQDKDPLFQIAPVMAYDENIQFEVDTLQHLELKADQYLVVSSVEDAVWNKVHDSANYPNEVKQDDFTAPASLKEAAPHRQYHYTLNQGEFTPIYLFKVSADGKVELLGKSQTEEDKKEHGLLKRRCTQLLEQHAKIFEQPVEESQPVAKSSEKKKDTPKKATATSPIPPEQQRLVFGATEPTSFDDLYSEEPSVAKQPQTVKQVTAPKVQEERLSPQQELVVAREAFDKLKRQYEELQYAYSMMSEEDEKLKLNADAHLNMIDDYLKQIKDLKTQLSSRGQNTPEDTQGLRDQVQRLREQNQLLQEQLEQAQIEKATEASMQTADPSPTVQPSQDTDALLIQLAEAFSEVDQLKRQIQNNRANTNRDTSTSYFKNGFSKGAFTLGAVSFAAAIAVAIAAVFTFVNPLIPLALMVFTAINFGASATNNTEAAPVSRAVNYFAPHQSANGVHNAQQQGVTVTHRQAPTPSSTYGTTAFSLQEGSQQQHSTNHDSVELYVP